MSITISELTDKIIAGYRLQRNEEFKDIAKMLLEADLDELRECAGRLQKHFCGNMVNLCSIINARSGRCSENCIYCAQASCNHTGVDEYPFLPKEEIFKAAKANADAGLNRFSIVTAGRALKGKDFEKALEAFREMHEKIDIGLCASMGFLDAEQFEALKDAGVTNYHDNLETSRRNFPNICTTHTYDQKVETIKTAQKVGLNVCSGGIIGMGETWEDRIDLAISLSELGIKSIPLNTLMPIPGTPLQHLPQLSGEDVMRTVCCFRFINPEAEIRLGAGRAVLPESGATIIGHGASGTISGNMLTTSGATSIASDIEMLKRLGLRNK